MFTDGRLQEEPVESLLPLRRLLILFGFFDGPDAPQIAFKDATLITGICRDVSSSIKVLQRKLIIILRQVVRQIFLKNQGSHFSL